MLCVLQVWVWAIPSDPVIVQHRSRMQNNLRANKLARLWLFRTQLIWIIHEDI